MFVGSSLSTAQPSSPSAVHPAVLWKGDLGLTLPGDQLDGAPQWTCSWEIPAVSCLDFLSHVCPHRTKYMGNCSIQDHLLLAAFSYLSSSVQNPKSKKNTRKYLNPPYHIDNFHHHHFHCKARHHQQIITIAAMLPLSIIAVWSQIC